MMTVDELRTFLKDVDDSFPIPLSEIVDLESLAHKFIEKGTVCVRYVGETPVAVAAGYTEQLVNNCAYISVVATRSSYRGCGYASQVVREFVEISRSKGADAVHLYTDSSNYSAIRMYQRIGFVDWKLDDEPRPNDVHLIYRIER